MFSGATLVSFISFKIDKPNKAPENSKMEGPTRLIHRTGDWSGSYL